MAKIIENVYSDLDLLFQPHPFKKDAPVLSDADAVKRAVRMIILTKYHERLFHPEIGCNATQVLFQPVSTLTAQQLKQSIEEAIGNFEKRAKLRNVVVTVRPDANSYEAIIEFFIRNNPNPQSLAVVLERSR